MSTKITSHRWLAKGMTLIELIMAIIIISAGVIGILSVLSFTAKSSADPIRYKQAMAMAEAIMEEVMAKELVNPVGGFVETSPQTCAGRLFYDDLNDYDCFDGSSSTKFIRSDITLAGTSSPLLNYTATVTVSVVTVSAIPMSRVSVTVTSGNVTVSLNGYRAI
ncbi:MSHA pilin protein MshD [Gammaproteobacteria bacterium]